MERYFLGGNTGEGFFGYYAQELRKKNRVVLLKGGPGTGKSTMLKYFGRECGARGLDHEEWMCSGDPSSLDGIYVKETCCAVVDATAPHALDPERPMIREVMFNLADALDADLLKANAAIINELAECKKRHFMRAYQHLKSAFGHKTSSTELSRTDLDESGVIQFGLNFYSRFRELADMDSEDGNDMKRQGKRDIFSRAICAGGNDEYFDHLRGREITQVKGGRAATETFFSCLAKMAPFGLILHDPLDPSAVEGIVAGNQAVVCRTGHFADSVSERIDLWMFGGNRDRDGETEEEAAEEQDKTLARAELAEARSCHSEIEKYYVAAMDFSVNEKIKQSVLEIITR